ncbi:hypothetical protein L873DRAFT_1701834, partial [Choiromyces venosus 120613-1]
LISNQLHQFSKAVYEKTNTLINCWGFLDCTIHGICYPVIWQKILCSSHKKFHAVKYSAVKAPDRIIYHLFVPYEGCQNNNTLLKDSDLLE